MACDPDIAIPPGARRRVARIMSGCGERGAGAAGRTAKGGVYHQRKPRASPLYQCADRHLAELRSEGRPASRPSFSGELILLSFSHLSPPQKEW